MARTASITQNVVPISLSEFEKARTVQSEAERAQAAVMKSMRFVGMQVCKWKQKLASAHKATMPCLTEMRREVCTA